MERLLLLVFSLAVAIGCALPTGDTGANEQSARSTSAALPERGWKEVPLLGDKYVVSAPDDATTSGSPANIMSAAISTEVREEVWIERHEFRFAVIAEELFVSCGNRFDENYGVVLEQIYGTPHAGNYAIESTSFETSVKSVVISLDEPIRRGDTTFLGTALLCGEDGALARLIFATDIGIEGDLKEVQGWRRKMSASVRAGSKTLDFSARTVRMSFSGEQISMPVPAGHFFYLDGGHDFVVYRVVELAELGGSTGSATLYFGGHPSPLGSTSGRSGKVLGKEVTWASSEGGDVLDCLVPLEDGLSLHAIVDSDDEARRGRLRSMIESASEE